MWWLGFLCLRAGVGGQCLKEASRYPENADDGPPCAEHCSGPEEAEWTPARYNADANAALSSGTAISGAAQRKYSAFACWQAGRAQLHSLSTPSQCLMCAVSADETNVMQAVVRTRA